MNSSVHGRRAPATFCMQAGANRSAALTPLHDTAGSGAFHRRGPTGGAANGIPLNTRTPASRPLVPASWPPDVVTIVGAAARTARPAHVAARTRLQSVARIAIEWAHSARSPEPAKAQSPKPRAHQDRLVR